MRYPRINRRIQAVIIDGLILLAVFFGTSLLLVPLEIHGAIKFGLVAALMLVPEPLLVSLTGGTPGHHLRGLRVQGYRDGTKLNLFRSFVRFLVRVILGWLSFLFVLVTKKRQAFHDLMAGSIVIVAHPDRFPADATLPEQVIEEAGYIYPSWWRRILMILVYNLAGFLFVGFAVIFSVSDTCVSRNVCSTWDNVIVNLIGFGWLIFVAISVILAWHGMLFGCRRKAA